MIKRFLTRGLISSLLGGFHYDANVSKFVNTVHLYSFLLFLLLPFGLHLIVPGRELVAIGYSIFTLGFFSIVKFLNYSAHISFDYRDKMEERLRTVRSKREGNGNTGSNDEKEFVEEPLEPVDTAALAQDRAIIQRETAEAVAQEQDHAEDRLEESDGGSDIEIVEHSSSEEVDEVLSPGEDAEDVNSTPKNEISQENEEREDLEAGGSGNDDVSEAGPGPSQDSSSVDEDIDQEDDKFQAVSLDVREVSVSSLDRVLSELYDSSDAEISRLEESRVVSLTDAQQEMDACSLGNESKEIGVENVEGEVIVDIDSYTKSPLDSAQLSSSGVSEVDEEVNSVKISEGESDAESKAESEKESDEVSAFIPESEPSEYPKPESVSGKQLSEKSDEESVAESADDSEAELVSSELIISAKSSEGEAEQSTAETEALSESESIVKSESSDQVASEGSKEEAEEEAEEEPDESSDSGSDSHKTVPSDREEHSETEEGGNDGKENQTNEGEKSEMLNVELVSRLFDYSRNVYEFSSRVMKRVTNMKKIDRMRVESILDRNYSVKETIISVVLAVLVSASAFLVIGFYHEGMTFLLFLVVATSHYSLIKAPQPDSASSNPFERQTAFSRSFYFIFISLMILLLDFVIANVESQPLDFTAYNTTMHTHTFLQQLLDALVLALLLLPIFHVIGVLPQPKTFLSYLAERVIIHLFGGSGIQGTFSAVFELTKLLLSTAILVTLAFLTKYYYAEVYVSVVVGLLFSLSWLTSRSPASIRLIVRTFVPGKLLSYLKVNTGEGYRFQKLNVKNLVFDLLFGIVAFILAFSVHLTQFFQFTNPYSLDVIAVIVIINGILLHQLFPIIVSPFPLKIFRESLLMRRNIHLTSNKKSGLRWEWIFGRGYGRYDTQSKQYLSKQWFEWIYRIAVLFEKFFFYQLLFLAAATQGIEAFMWRADGFWSLLPLTIIFVALMRAIRGAMNDTSQYYVYVFITLMFFTFDMDGNSETFAVDFLFTAFVIGSVFEFMMKVRFVIMYLVPWNINIYSVLHLVLQHMGIPHTTFVIMQVALSSLISAPLYPFLGSGLFLLGYPRCVKYWERNYETKRMDQSDRKLISSFSDSGAADSVGNIDNLNSIFYEHLNKALSNRLYDDIMEGRLGKISAGDILVMLENRMSLFLHVIEIGNGFCSFQIRGLEFQKTVCHEREITEVTDLIGDIEKWPFAVMNPLYFWKHFWTSWTIANDHYSTYTYNALLYNASSSFNSRRFRTELIIYYVKSMVFFLLIRPELEDWLALDDLFEGGGLMGDRMNKSKDYSYIMIDSTRCDPDNFGGEFSLTSFIERYAQWIEKCIKERNERFGLPTIPFESSDENKYSRILRLSFMLSITARRYLLKEQIFNESTDFIDTYYSLFKGDFRLMVEDDWLRFDIDMIQKGLKMSFKILQDYTGIMVDFSDDNVLYNTIYEANEEMIICHESDPLWKENILSDHPNLLALRRVENDVLESIHYYTLHLKLENVRFTVLKINREAVRGLWGAQIQELLYFQSQAKERPSIQQMTSVLRNLINQACDIPVGYPIFVGPISTSFSSMYV